VEEFLFNLSRKQGSKKRWAINLFITW